MHSLEWDSPSSPCLSPRLSPYSSPRLDPCLSPRLAASHRSLDLDHFDRDDLLPSVVFHTIFNESNADESQTQSQSQTHASDASFASFELNPSLSPINKRAKIQEKQTLLPTLPPLLSPLGTPPKQHKEPPAAPVKQQQKRDIHKWCDKHNLEYRKDSAISSPIAEPSERVQVKNLYDWALGQETYIVRFLKSGQFHNVYTFEENRTITLLVNTRLDQLERLDANKTDEKVSEDFVPDTVPDAASSTRATKWKQMSLKTEDWVLRILNVKIATLQSERNRLNALQEENRIALHCLQHQIPFIEKITSFFPGGTPLPHDYVNPEDPTNQKEPILGWELCKRVLAKDFIKPLCHEIRQAHSMQTFLIENPQPGSAPHLFQWLITQWEAHMAHMIQTSTHHTVLGKALLEDFKPDNVGFDPASRTFVCIDLKLELEKEDGIVSLNGSLKDFLVVGSVAYGYVRTALIEYARSSHATEEFLTRLQEALIMPHQKQQTKPSRET